MGADGSQCEVLYVTDDARGRKLSIVGDCLGNRVGLIMHGRQKPLRELMNTRKIFPCIHHLPIATGNVNVAEQVPTLPELCTCL